MQNSRAFLKNLKISIIVPIRNKTIQSLNQSVYSIRELNEEEIKVLNGSWIPKAAEGILGFFIPSKTKL